MQVNSKRIEEVEEVQGKEKRRKIQHLSFLGELMIKSNSLKQISSFLSIMVRLILIRVGPIRYKSIRTYDTTHVVRS